MKKVEDYERIRKAYHIEGLSFNINSRVQLLKVGAFSMLKWAQFKS